MKVRRTLRIKIIILILIVISFMSFTYAWFTYNSNTSINTVVDVRAWNVEFLDGADVVTNDIIITTGELYPGMETISKEIMINNHGDADASIKAIIESAEILGINLLEANPDITSEEIIDKLAHDYPFHINISIDDNYLERKSGVSKFEFSISWPFNSGNDVEDTAWGYDAYEFKEAENQKLLADPSYEIKNPVMINLSVEAAQEVEGSIESYDPDYRLGDTYLFNVVDNKSCTSVSTTCLKTTVIEKNNLLNDDEVMLLPDLINPFRTSDYNSYLTNYNTLTTGWVVNHRALSAEDLLNVVSIDVVDSIIQKDTMSDIIIGNLEYLDRATTIINDTVAYGGKFTFTNSEFTYLNASSCVWTNTMYDVNSTFSLSPGSVTQSNIIQTDNTSNCKIVPVIIAKKTALETI